MAKPFNLEALLECSAKEEAAVEAAEQHRKAVADRKAERVAAIWKVKSDLCKWPQDLIHALKDPKRAAACRSHLKRYVLTTVRLLADAEDLQPPLRDRLAAKEAELDSGSDKTGMAHAEEIAIEILKAACSENEKKVARLIGKVFQTTTEEALLAWNVYDFLSQWPQRTTAKKGAAPQTAEPIKDAGGAPSEYQQEMGLHFPRKANVSSRITEAV